MSAQQPKTPKELKESIKTLEKQALESKIYINNVVIINKLLSNENSSVKFAAIESLERIFANLFASDSQGKRTTSTGSLQKLYNWLDEQFLSFLKNILRVIKNSDEEETLVFCLKHYLSSLKIKTDFNYQIEKYHLLLKTILLRPFDQENPILDELVNSHFVYKDLLIFGLEYFTKILGKVQNIIKKTEKTQRKQVIMTKNVFNLFQTMNVESTSQTLDFAEDVLTEPFFENVYEEDVESSKKRKAPMDIIKKLKEGSERERYQKAYVDLWLVFLRLPLTPKMYKVVLLMIPDLLLPLIPKAGILFEYFMHAFGTGGVTAILALNGIFILMTQHQLEYPDFYKSLYNLINQVIYKIKFRGKLYHYLSIFLNSSYLPSYLVASFIKRLARLSLTLPSFAILPALGLIFNLLEKHPVCRELIHRTKKVNSNDVLMLSEKSDKLKGSDPYLHEEEDPAKSNAQDSSLWELEALRQHYDPDVSNFIKVFEGTLSRQQFDLDELTSFNFQQEIDKRLKAKFKVAHLAFKPPAKLFQTEDKFDEWDFTA